jgi:hypothetical protein
MSLSVPAGALSCGAGSCDVGTGFPFTLAVNVVARPAAGYALMQTYVDYGFYDPAASEDGAGANSCSDSIENGGADGQDRFDSDCVSTNIIYKPAAQVSDEIVWPDLDASSALKSEDGPGLLGFGGLTSLTLPLPASTYSGSVVETQFTCVTAGVQTVIELLPNGDSIALTKGALFVEPDGITKVTPKVGSFTINCVAAVTPTNSPAPTVTPTPTITNTPTITPTPTATPEKQPEPGDTDGDGCSDQRENGPDEKLGGQRDYVNPNDYYDVNGDKIIDLPNDVLGVVFHYAPTGLEAEYDVTFDRGPSAGPNAWNMTAPDGVIDLSNDILGVVFQYQHNCQ